MHCKKNFNSVIFLVNRSGTVRGCLSNEHNAIRNPSCKRSLCANTPKSPVVYGFNWEDPWLAAEQSMGCYNDNDIL